MIYPLATKTFSVLRKTNVTNASGNVVPAGPQTIETGVSVMLRDLNAELLNEKSTELVLGQFRGQTFLDQDIRAGDVLSDEAENDARGNPIQYRVNQATKNAPLYLKLHLTQLRVGV